MVNERADILRRVDEVLAAVLATGDASLLDDVRARVNAAGRADRSVAELDSGADDADWHGMIGSCEPLLAIRSQAQKFANAQAPILIRGESGTGKDVLAKILHQISPRADHAFVSENCAAVPTNLIESVLFGHKRGSFTGAFRDHGGHFVTAHRGTLFLDEIGDMALAMQAKLLRALQEGEIRPIGANSVQKVDVRIIAATNQDLEAMVAAGTFREDLYYRINVLQLYLPPLRERGDDVVRLARLFLANACARAGRELELDPDAESALAKAPWPGNVRQLQNEVQRVAVLATGPRVTVADLSPEIG